MRQDSELKLCKSNGYPVQVGEMGDVSSILWLLSHPPKEQKLIPSGIKGAFVVLQIMDVLGSILHWVLKLGCCMPISLEVK